MMGTHYQGTADEVRAINAYIKLQRAAESVASRATRHLAKLGLTSSQYGVLDMLFHLGPLSQGQIAEKLVKSDGNITTIVDNLARRGLVDRERHTRDRRVVTVSLTEAGRTLLADVLPVHIGILIKEMSPLSPAEQEVLGRLCRRLGKQEQASAVEEDSARELEERRR